MTVDKYLENINKRFEKHFEVEKDAVIFGEQIDIVAKFCDISGRTFITKADIIDRCENYEYCYIKKFDIVTEAHVNAYGQFLKKLVDEQIKPGKDHMSTYVTGVIVGNNIDTNAKKSISKFSYSRAYSFYLRGWCDVRYICVSIDDNEVITNKAGKRVQKVYNITL